MKNILSFLRRQESTNGEFSHFERKYRQNIISMETLTKPYEEKTCQLMLEKLKEMKCLNISCNRNNRHLKFVHTIR